MTHTKGKWILGTNIFGQYLVGIQKKTPAITETVTICTISIDIDEYEANAKLIASAPELLEALKNCQLGIEKMIGWEDVNKQALEIIKKAEEVIKHTKP